MSQDPSDLRHHDDVELVADLSDQTSQVVQTPRRIETVDARPQLTRTEVGFLRDLYQSLTRVDLLVRRDRVLEVAQQHVHLRSDIGHLRRHLRIARVEEVNHPRRSERNLARRLRRTESERLEEILWASHDLLPVAVSRCCRSRSTTASPLVDRRVNRRASPVVGPDPSFTHMPLCWGPSRHPADSDRPTSRCVGIASRYPNSTG